MNIFQLQKRNRDRLNDPGQTAKQDPHSAVLKRQLAWAAGTDAFEEREPSYHLSEEFISRFNYLGMLHARAAGQEEAADLSDSAGHAAARKERQEAENQDFAGHRPSDKNLTDMEGNYVTRKGNGEFLSRFSEVGFKRGNLSTAIMNGTGKMMLFSVLKRTVGQEQSLNFKERKLFQSHSIHKDIPGSQNSAEIVNRYYAKSAVAMVVDVMKDARRSLDSLEKMAAGESQIDGESGRETLWKMYPFLDTHKDEMLIAEYEKRLREAVPGGEEERLLAGAREKAVQTLLKKQQTKREFLEQLRRLQKQAREAEKEFSSPGFFEEKAAAENPDKKKKTDPPPDADGAKGTDGTEDGKGAENGADTGGKEGRSGEIGDGTQ